MPDLTPAEQATLDASGVTPGPGSPLSDAVDRSPMPIPPALDDDGVDLSMLSAEDIRARIVARERDMKFRVNALKHEVVTVGEDLNVGGRPVLDIVRADATRAVAVAAGSGLLVGIVLGIVSRLRNRPEPDHGLEAVQARLAYLVEDAARRVARGTSAEDALRATTRDLPVYTPAPRAAAAEQAKSSIGQAVDMAVKSAVGFALKAATDQLTRKLTGKSDTVEAVAEAPDRS